LPPAGNPDLKLTTEFLSIVVGMDEAVTLDLARETENVAQIVGLEVRGLPSDWEATFRGRGKTIHAIYIEPKENSEFNLRIQPPDDVKADSYPFEVLAIGPDGEAVLPIELTVEERAPVSLKFEIDLPTLRGKPSPTFRYNVTLKNEGDEDLTVDLFAEAPPAFGVTFISAGQEVTTIPVEADGSKRLDVEAEPLLNQIPSHTYSITLRAQGGDVTTSAELVAEVVGQSSITLTTPDGRLSGDAEAGAETTYTLQVRNQGSAAANAIALGASQPNGWNVEFDPSEIGRIEPGEQVEVTAHVQPAEKALAGDYMVTFRADAEDGASESIDFRVTVRTSTIWGVVGIALIAVSVAVVGWTVMRFGRR
jgi:uncharacterized membrane protein